MALVIAAVAMAFLALFMWDILDTSSARSEPFEEPRKTTDAELALLLGRADTRMKSGNPVLQVAQGEVEVMADRSTRHARSLVNG